MPATCLASDQPVRGQPDLGKIALADAPVDGIEPDGVRFTVHDDDSGGRRPSVSAVLSLYCALCDGYAADPLR